MNRLIFPSYKHRIEKRGNELYIFDVVRKKFVLLTPEEWVRQHVVNFLTVHKKYPLNRISVERELKFNDLSKRTDILVYDRAGNIELLAEIKNPWISLDEVAVKQILTYNKTLNSRYLLLTNGQKIILFDSRSGEYLEDIPAHQ